MIFGIGTDIVAISRIESAMGKHGDRFVQRILAAAEMEEHAKATQPIKFIAKRFAVKEAFSKAFGTGIGEAVGWHDVWVTHNALGKPEIAVSDALQVRLKAAGITNTHVSISDEVDCAVAYVILEKA